MGDRESTRNPECEKFWRDIYPDLVIPDELMSELCDFSFLMSQALQVYYVVTGGRMSKINYFAESVIGVAEDYRQEVYESEVIYDLHPIAAELDINAHDFSDDKGKLIEAILEQIRGLRKK